MGRKSRLKYTYIILHIYVISRGLILTNPGMYIINLDDSKGPGTHWVAMISNSEDKAIYFGSFGVPPPEEVINVHDHWYYNYCQYQNPRSVMCG